MQRQCNASWIKLCKMQSWGLSCCLCWVTHWPIRELAALPLPQGKRSCDAPCGGELEITAAFPDGGQITKAAMEEGLRAIDSLEALYGGGISLLDFTANDAAAR